LQQVFDKFSTIFSKFFSATRFDMPQSALSIANRAPNWASHLRRHITTSRCLR
jgi:hypothetical protein